MANQWNHTWPANLIACSIIMNYGIQVHYGVGHGLSLCCSLLSSDDRLWWLAFGLHWVIKYHWLYCNIIFRILTSIFTVLQSSDDDGSEAHHGGICTS